MADIKVIRACVPKQLFSCSVLWRLLIEVMLLFFLLSKGVMHSLVAYQKSLVLGAVS